MSTTDLREIQRKSTMTYHYTPTRMTKIQNTDSNRYTCGCVVDTAWSSFQGSDCCPRCQECWQPSSPSFRGCLAASYSRSQWQMAQRGTILRGRSNAPLHPNPRLLACIATLLPLSNLTSYYSLPQELIPRALRHKHPAYWALTLLPTESVLGHGTVSSHTLLGIV